MKIEKYYDTDNAKNYEQRRAGGLWQSENKAFVKMYNTILKTYDSDKTMLKILDLPVGTGRWIPFLTSNVKSYVGVDISPYMLEEAESKINDNSKFDTNFENHEWENYLPTVKQHYDLIISTRFFAHFNANDTKKMMKMFSDATSGHLITQVRACDNHFTYYLEILLGLIKNPFRMFKRWKKSGRLSTSHPRSVYMNGLSEAGFDLKDVEVLQKDFLSDFEYWLVKKK
jgi:SAM-dependent methyltransferase